MLLLQLCFLDFSLIFAMNIIIFFLYPLKMLTCTLYLQPLRALACAAFFNHWFNDTYHEAKSSFPPSIF